MARIIDLEAKIDLVLEHGRRLLTTGDKRATQKSLAEYIGIDDRKLSVMIRGRNEKGNQPEDVPDAILGKLADLLAKIVDGKCTAAEARRLWEGGLVEFQIALGCGPQADIFEILAGATDKLEITVRLRNKSSLRAVLAAEIIPAGAIDVASNRRVEFTIAAKLPRKLLAVCLEPGNIWRLIAPGKLHPGEIETNRTVFPVSSMNGIPIEEPFGVHRFVFIEYDAKLEPLLPSKLPDNRILDRGQIADIARKLANPAFASQWRGGEIIINAVQARGRGAG